MVMLKLGYLGLQLGCVDVAVGLSLRFQPHVDASHIFSDGTTSTCPVDGKSCSAPYRNAQVCRCAGCEIAMCGDCVVTVLSSSE